MAPKTPPQSMRSASMSMFTPPTPRYAPVDEPDSREVYHSKQTSTNVNTKQQMAAPVAAQHFLTPAETPARQRRTVEDMGSGAMAAGRVLFPTHTPKVPGSGRQRKRSRHGVVIHPTSSKSTSESGGGSGSKVRIVSPTGGLDDVKKFQIFDETKAMRKEIDNEDPFAGIEDPFDSEPVTKKPRTEGPASSSTSTSTPVPTRHPHHPPSTDQQGVWYIFRGKQVFRPMGASDDFADSVRPRRLFQEEISRREREQQQQQSEPQQSETLNSAGVEAAEPPSTPPAQTAIDSEEEDTDREDLDSSPPSMASSSSASRPPPSTPRRRRSLTRSPRTPAKFRSYQNDKGSTSRMLFR